MKTETWMKIAVIMGAMGLQSCFSLEIEAPPAVTQTCDFVMHDLSVTDDYVDPEIKEALNENRDLPLLYLSGGSQSGAFGAGYLKGWAENNGKKLPEFAIVTGVSTGAILSLAAFTNKPDIAVDAYTIEKESDALTLFVKNRGDELSLGDYVSTVKSGAVADLIPLRDRISENINNHDLITEISNRADKKRKLFAIVTNLDDGYARAVDLTDMAQSIKRSADATEKQRLQTCFIEALVASSSVPLAAKPVFIDDVMYIDGGARFGAMSHRIGAANKEAMPKIDGTKRDVYAIFNGDQKVKDDCSICGPREDGTGRHKNWSLPGLAERSISILIDQIYQFSQDKITRDSIEGDFNIPKIIKMEKSLETFKTKLKGETGSRTCQAWRDIDDAVANPPLEFHPKYMQCLIEYGKSLAGD